MDATLREARPESHRIPTAKWTSRSSDDRSTLRIVLALVTAAAVALPFAIVRFPPATDLPQHVAQLRLFLDAMGNPHSAYRIQWFTPYNLVYALLGIAWVCCGPLTAGRMALLALGLLWVAATHLLAAERRRPPEAAALASLLFFSPILYWGFVSFAMGWPVFLLWLVVTTRAPAERFTWRPALALFGGAVLLYMSHALWFAAGMTWLALHSIVFRVPWRIAAWRVASVSPILVAAALWYPHLAASGFVSDTVWTSTPIERLSFAWLASTAAGGLRGPAKYAMLATLLGWIGLSAWQHRRTFWYLVDRELLLAGALCSAGALLLPYEYMNTIEFAERWTPPALALLVLAVPRPAVKPLILRAAACAVVVVFSLSTALAWNRFERTELSGLQESLAALPDSPRVVELDLLKGSAVVDKWPFLHVYAYAQVLHGGTLYFSFAAFAPMPVILKDRRNPPWAAGRAWGAEVKDLADLRFFDFAIVGGDADLQERYAALASLTPVTQDGVWRLYRIRQPPQ